MMKGIAWHRVMMGLDRNDGIFFPLFLFSRSTLTNLL